MVFFLILFYRILRGCSEITIKKPQGYNLDQRNCSYRVVYNVINLEPLFS